MLELEKLDEAYKVFKDAHEIDSDNIKTLINLGNILSLQDNILEAIKQAKRKKMKVISFLGKTGGICKGKADLEFMIKSDSTARIQEMHILLGHILCDLIERKLKL